MSPLAPIDHCLAQKLTEKPLSQEARVLLQWLVYVSRSGELFLDLDPRALLTLTLDADLVTVLRKGWDDLEPHLPTIPTVIYAEGALFLQKHYRYHRTICMHLERLQQRSVSPWPFPFSEEKEVQFSLHPAQQEAVRKACTTSLSFITGGPGTGKTYTAAAIVAAGIRAGITTIHLTAPTGKAAAHLHKKLSSIPGVTSGTLHALLHKEALVHPDLLIIDESSMMSAEVFSRLLEAICDQVRVVFLGDVHQLPPVDAGRPFAMCLNHLPDRCVTSLTHCQRTEDRTLLTLSQAILNGEKEPLLPFLSPLEISVIESLLSFFPHKTCEPPDLEMLSSQKDTFILLSCLRKGPFGADAMNAHLLRLLMEEPIQGDFLVIPILISKNDSTLDLYNGDTGFLVRHLHAPQDSVAYFPGKPPLSERALGAFEYAYCLSVHKSQGSEYDRVLVILGEGSERFGKEILYTAVTRAKKEVGLLGNKETLEQILN